MISTGLSFWRAMSAARARGAVVSARESVYRPAGHHPDPRRGRHCLRNLRQARVGIPLKCPWAGFEWIVYVCNTTYRRQRTDQQPGKSGVPIDFRGIEFLTKRQVIVRLDKIAERLKATENAQASGIGKTMLNRPNELGPEVRKDGFLGLPHIQCLRSSWDAEYLSA